MSMIKKKSFGEFINKILTVVSLLFLMIWAWRYFGPGGDEVRVKGSAEAAKIGMSFADFMWIGIAVSCGGYLLWRFLSYIFWKKYFTDDFPSGDNENDKN